MRPPRPYPDPGVTPIDPNFTLATLGDLIRIDSRNPELESDAPGEEALARHVAGVLHELGWAAEVHELAPGRANTVATRPGTGTRPSSDSDSGGGASLMINVHLDTVGVAGMVDPFSGERRDGRVRGRGAQDTKGGMAAVLGLAKALADDGVDLQGDLVLAFVADEEHGSLGTADVLRRVRTDAAVVIEPTDLDVCVGHRGFAVFRITTRGRAAHGGQSELGVDANLHMGAVLTGLRRLAEVWRERHRHPLLGSAALHVPLLSGGRHLFTYADSCALELECRTVPGQSHAAILQELEALLASLRDDIEDFEGSLEPGLWRSPFEIDPARPIVRTALAAVEQVRGEPARTIVHPWWEDSGLYAEAGIDTVVLGPVGEGLHTDEEWVDGGSVVDLGRILHAIALAYCGRAGNGARRDDVRSPKEREPADDG
jgi:acetylornithine deacetylase